jgi:hypothetical protein
MSGHDLLILGVKGLAGGVLVVAFALLRYIVFWWR